MALGVGVLDDAGVGEAGDPLVGTVDPGADGGAEAGPEHPAALSATADRSSAGIPPSLRIQSA
jgi:hypothetical protein